MEGRKSPGTVDDVSSVVSFCSSVTTGLPYVLTTNVDPFT